MAPKRKRQPARARTAKRTKRATPKRSTAKRGAPKRAAPKRAKRTTAKRASARRTARSKPRTPSRRPAHRAKPRARAADPVVVYEPGRDKPAREEAARPAPPAPAVETRPAASPAGDGETIVDVDNLRVFYGAVEALRGISFQVRSGEVVAIIGSNGAGKTTTLKTVSGVSELLKTVRGAVSILGNRVERAPAHKIAHLGVAHVPEGRKIFPNQTVRDNLLIGAFGRKDGEVDKDIDEQYQRFPILGERRNQPAGLMSGGEQQMLAIARALMSRPKVILFDEPSMGLAPLIVKQVFEIIRQLHDEGRTILLVEQMAFQALEIADRAYVLENGTITLEGTGRALLENPKIKEAYLGA